MMKQKKYIIKQKTDIKTFNSQLEVYFKNRKPQIINLIWGFSFKPTR